MGRAPEGEDTVREEPPSDTGSVAALNAPTARSVRCVSARVYPLPRTWCMLIDAGDSYALLLVGKLMRASVGVVRWLLPPASVITGVLGLALTR